MRIVDSLLGVVSVLVEWFSPRMKAARLIGLYARSQDRRQAITYLESVVALSDRRPFRLQDELLLFVAYSALFAQHLMAREQEMAIRNGLRAASILTEGRD